MPEYLLPELPDLKDYDSREPRDDNGRWSAGGASGSGTDAKPHGTPELHAKAETKAKTLAGKLKEIPAAAAKKAAAMVKKQYEVLANRYGKPAAFGIVAGGLAVGLATPLAVIPGSTTVGMAPFAAVAELYLQTKKLYGRVFGKKDAGEELSDARLKSLGRKWLVSVAARWERMRAKALAEGGGTAGGYTVADERPSPERPKKRRRKPDEGVKPDEPKQPQTEGKAAPSGDTFPAGKSPAPAAEWAADRFDSAPLLQPPAGGAAGQDPVLPDGGEGPGSVGDQG